MQVRKRIVAFQGIYESILQYVRRPSYAIPRRHLNALLFDSPSQPPSHHLSRQSATFQDNSSQVNLTFFTQVSSPHGLLP